MTTFSPPTPSCPLDQSRAVIAALVGTVLLAATIPALALLPRPGEPVAILSRDARDPALFAAIGEAGGRVAGLTGSHVTIAVPGDLRFSERLHAQGYWLLLDAQALGGCLPAQPTTQRS